MRKTCLNMVQQLAEKDGRVVFIGSDLSPGLLAEMNESMPDRHYMEGIMEANVVGMAAGMAFDGLMPYVNTIATFITRRCYEQVAMDVCQHDLPVRLIGNGGGVVYAPLGPTHLAIEDIAIMRALPNMTVVAVSDAEEMVRLMEASLDWPHPIYIRLGKGGDPVVSRPELKFEIGKAIPLRQGDEHNEVIIFSTGVMTGRVLEAAEKLSQAGIEATVIHMHTIKPLDRDAIIKYALNAKYVFSVEEHIVSGGLGTAISDVILEETRGIIPVIRKLGLPDKFPHNYGVQDDLLGIYGLQPDAIAQKIQEEVEYGG